MAAGRQAVNAKYVYVCVRRANNSREREKEGEDGKKVVSVAISTLFL